MLIGNMFWQSLLRSQATRTVNRGKPYNFWLCLPTGINSQTTAIGESATGWELGQIRGRP